MQWALRAPWALAPRGQLGKAPRALGTQFVPLWAQTMSKLCQTRLNYGCNYKESFWALSAPWGNILENCTLDL